MSPFFTLGRLLFLWIIVFILFSYKKSYYYFIIILFILYYVHIWFIIWIKFKVFVVYISSITITPNPYTRSKTFLLLTYDLVFYYYFFGIFLILVQNWTSVLNWPLLQIRFSAILSPRANSFSCSLTHSHI